MTENSSSNFIVITGIMMAVSVIMALVALIALTASFVICCKRASSKATKGEPHSVYYSTVVERAAAVDPTYDEVSNAVKTQDIDTEPNSAYHTSMHSTR